MSRADHVGKAHRQSEIVLHTHSDSCYPQHGSARQQSLLPLQPGIHKPLLSSTSRDAKGMAAASHLRYHPHIVLIHLGSEAGRVQQVCLVCRVGKICLHMHEIMIFGGQVEKQLPRVAAPPSSSMVVLEERLQELVCLGRLSPCHPHSITFLVAKPEEIVQSSQSSEHVFHDLVADPWLLQEGDQPLDQQAAV